LFTLTVENKRGDRYQLTHNQNVVVTGVSGLTPPAATVNLSNVVNDDGSVFNSSKVNERNLVINLRLLHDVEQQRQLLYRFFQTKQYCKIYYKNSNRDVYIEGYVEAIEGDLFTKSQQLQISIICPKPFFKGLNDIYYNMSAVIGLFEFPFSIPAEGVEFSRIEKSIVASVFNSGDVETGLKFEFRAKGTVINPIVYSVADPSQYFKINIAMQNSDVIKVNTNKGEKSVTLTREGVTTNIMNLIDRNNKWFILDVGENQFTYTCDQGEADFYCEFILSELFGGV
jgi:predicted phage tail component-like protein